MTDHTQNMYRDGLGRLTWPPINMTAPQTVQPTSAAPADRMKWERFEYDFSIVKQQLKALHTAIVALNDMTKALSAISDSKSSDRPLVDKVFDVIKGIQDGKVSPKQVDQLADAASRSKQDRAVGSAIGRK